MEGSPTVVFDEVDAGVGGATARAVGERLRALSDGRQVLCVTHLPQVASLATRHFRVVKQAQPLRDAARAGGGVARADVERLDRGQLVEELCRMLGADTGDEAARRHAERLLEPHQTCRRSSAVAPNRHLDCVAQRRWPHPGHPRV